MRKPSPIRALQPLVGLPGMISLGGGMPNPSTFPFDSFSFTLKTEDGEAGNEEDMVIHLPKKDIETMLQYSQTPGLIPLTTLLSDLILREHCPPYVEPLRERRKGGEEETRKAIAKEFSLCVTTGSQDGLAKAFELFFDEKSSILAATPCYSGALASLEPVNGNLIGVDTDEQGIIPESLEKVLSEFDPACGYKRPRALYLIPNGGNPTGASYSVDRRKKVYEIARRPENDLIILEDDPYYYLQFSAQPKPSFLSMDIDGRVLRFDSFSKLLSSGLRIGYVSGPTELISKINLHSQASNIHPSGLSQMLILKLMQKWNVDKHYGLFGSEEKASVLAKNHFKAHAQKVANLYKQRRDIFIKYCEQHLQGLATWSVPEAGMFVWFKVIGVNDTTQLIQSKAVEKKVLLLPGSAFVLGGTPTCFVRAAFSTASEDEMNTAIQRFAALIKENQEL
eukprot:Nk52_evm53s2118 gene=Nk52_evmTU53s2118